MSRSGGLIEIILLHILAMIPFGSCQTEKPLLQDRIATVPQGECNGQAALGVGDSQEPVLTPPIRALRA